MNRKRHRLFTVTIACAFVLTGGVGAVYVNRMAAAPSGVTDPLAPADHTRVRVVDVQAQSIPLSFTARGALEGFEEVTVHAEVDGQVLTKLIDVGHRVQKGQALFELDQTFRRLTVRQLTANVETAKELQRQAKAGLENARAQVAEAEAAQQNAINEYERIERLQRQGNSVPVEVDRIATNKRRCDAHMRMANAALAAAVSKTDASDAALDLAEAQLEEARERLERCAVTSPIDGVVSMVAIDAGEYVRPTQPVCEVIRDDKFKLTVELNAAEAVLIEPGSKAALHVDARPDQAYEAVVVRVGPRANPMSKKFPIELHVDNRRTQLMAGMFCLCELPAGRRDGIILLPREAVVERYGGHYCYVVRSADDGLTAQSVRVRIRSVPGRSGEIQIVSGLALGARVIATGVEQLRDGEAIGLEEPAGLAAGVEKPRSDGTP
ncbi:MAG: efflux RND transporter periplasmic adaptor subunit [Phycisphaerae bacterium]|nr:efflux RND transporter periplasmic adaptor subunit [Phycisphaerae bacterium]